MGTIEGSVETFGRNRIAAKEAGFAHALLAGLEMSALQGAPFETWEVYVLGLNVPAIVEPHGFETGMIQRWRLGGDVLTPFGLGGAYLNLGEAVDFFVGLVCLDVAGDDGLADEPETMDESDRSRAAEVKSDDPRAPDAR